MVNEERRTYAQGFVRRAYDFNTECWFNEKALPPGGLKKKVPRMSPQTALNTLAQFAVQVAGASGRQQFGTPDELLQRRPVQGDTLRQKEIARDRADYEEMVRRMMGR